MAEEALRATKSIQRTAKGALIQGGKSLARLIDAERPE